MASNEKDPSLTPTQLNALFDILTHTETFSEVRGLRYEAPVSCFGPPLTPLHAGTSPFPLLQLLMSKFIGQSLYSEAGWADWLAMVQRLCAANLSDSYDKAFLGLRKHAATGIAAALESVARGVLAGAPRDPHVKLALLNTKRYDKHSAEQLEQAWDDAVQGMLYGDLLDRVFDAVEASPDINDMPTVARTALDYFMICGATLMHYALVLFPEGQNLVNMADVIDTLTPYAIIKQTVRVGNVQSMLNGILKILLAKVSDKNLVQTMASRAIKLDLHDLEKRAEKIKKKSKDGRGLPKEMFNAIDDYVQRPSSVQENTRHRSQREGKSIIASILDTYYPAYPPEAVQNITHEQHTQALEYLSVQLSIRDRLEGVQAACKDKPDLLSPIVKEQMALITPLLKALHDGKFDVGQVITLHKVYTEDFLKTAKITKDHVPSVGDFYALFQRHVPALWRILHDGRNKCPSLHTAVYGWCSDALGQFRSHTTQDGELRTGAMTGPLSRMFDGLPAEQKKPVQAALDDHAAYLVAGRMASREMLQNVLSRRCSPDQIGPGPVLPRWHALLDATLLTPTSMSGSVRTGLRVSAIAAQQSVVGAPDSSVVRESLGKPFRAFLAEERSSSLSMGGMAASLPRVSISEPRDNVSGQKKGAVIPA